MELRQRRGKGFPKDMGGSMLSTESPEKEPVMKLRASLFVAVAILMAAGGAGAQQAAPAASATPSGAAEAPPDLSPDANPAIVAGHAGGARCVQDMVETSQSETHEVH